MAYQPITGDPAPETIRRLTFVLFLSDGRCVVPAGPDPLLPTGEVAPGEHWLLDTSIRVPLETVGFRMQRARPFAIDGDHLFVWLEGDSYTGRRPHATVELRADSAAAIAAQLHQDQSGLVLDAAASHAGQSEADYYADSVRLLEPAYLRGRTVEQGSGFGGDSTAWRAGREMVVDGIDRDGTFLDVGCANGLLMESVHQWAAERGLTVQPHGVDLAPGLVASARARLPHWADRIEQGNAIDYRPSGGQRFGFVHLLLDLVPANRKKEMVGHALRSLVEPGGRVLVSSYQPLGGTAPAAGPQLRVMGFTVAGESRAAAFPGDGPDGVGCPASTAWLAA